MQDYFQNNDSKESQSMFDTLNRLVSENSKKYDLVLQELQKSNTALIEDTRRYRDTLLKRLQKIDYTLDGHDKKFEELSNEIKRTNDKLAIYDKKFDDISNNILRINDTVAKLKDTLAAHDKKFDDISNDVSEVKDTVTTLKDTVTTHDKKLDTLYSTVQKIDNTTTVMEYEFGNKISAVLDSCSLNSELQTNTSKKVEKLEEKVEDHNTNLLFLNSKIKNI